jgi:hypothetical protein
MFAAMLGAMRASENDRPRCWLREASRRARFHDASLPRSPAMDARGMAASVDPTDARKTTVRRFGRSDRSAQASRGSTLRGGRSQPDPLATQGCTYPRPSAAGQTGTSHNLGRPRGDQASTEEIAKSGEEHGVGLEGLECLCKGGGQRPYPAPLPLRAAIRSGRVRAGPAAPAPRDPVKAGGGSPRYGLQLGRNPGSTFVDSASRPQNGEAPARCTRGCIAHPRRSTRPRRWSQSVVELKLGRVRATSAGR